MADIDAKGTATPAPKPAAVTSTASGRTITTSATDDAAIPPNAKPTEAPLGSVKEALKSEIPVKEAKEDASEKKRDEKSVAPIVSAAQLRDFHIANGTAPTSKQVTEVKEIEAKILEEGGKQLRTNPKV